MTEFQELMKTRRSVRAFKPDAVPQDLLDEIFTEALEAPSSSNLQPFMIANAHGAVKDRISEDLTHRFDLGNRVKRQSRMQQLVSVMRNPEIKPNGDIEVITKYPADLINRSRITGAGLYEVMGIDRKDYVARDAAMRRNFEFFEAPHALFFFAHEGVGHYGPLDAGIYMQTLALAAADRGLGTCMQGALAMWAEPVRKEFAIPDHYQLLVGMSLGFPADEPVNQYRPPKKGLSELMIPLKGQGAG